MRIESFGKLYLCGEYAVLRPGSKALVAPVRRKLWAEISLSERSELYSSAFPKPASFSWQKSFFASGPPESRFALHVLKQTEGLCRQMTGKDLKYKVSLGSDLEEEGKKFGFGSSAALCCSLTKAVTSLYSPNLSREEEMKLAIFSHFSWQGSGSGGDVAASYFGCPVFYASFDAPWLLANIWRGAAIIFERWPGLEAEPLPFLPLSSLAMWTGSPAITKNLIRGVRPGLKFCSRSDFLCLKGAEAIKRGDAEALENVFALSRRNLESFSSANRIPLEASGIRRALKIADSIGVRAKTSGAGGGDCALALAAEGRKLCKLSESWGKVGIRVFEEVLLRGKDGCSTKDGHD